MFYTGTFKKINRDYDTKPNNWSNIHDVLLDNTNIRTPLNSPTDYAGDFIKGWEAIGTILLMNFLNKNKRAQPIMNFSKYRLSGDEIKRQAEDYDFNIFKIRNSLDRARYIDVIFISQGWGIFSELDKNTTLTELKAISMSLQTGPSHRIRVYKNAHNQNSITVVTNKYDAELGYKLLALFPKFFPEIEIDNADFPELLKAMGELNHPKFLELFEKIIKDIKLLKLVNKQRFTKAFELIESQQLIELNNRIENKKRSIKDYERALTNLYTEINKNQRILAGLKLLSEGESGEKTGLELLDFLNSVKTITDYSIDPQYSKLYLTIESPITYYDKEFLEAVIRRNPEKIGSEGSMTRQFILDIFIHEKYKVINKTRTTIELTNNKVSCTTTSNSHMNGVLINPHLMRHDCWGDNRGHIQKSLAENDYIGAINQIVGASMNLNIQDSHVFNRFVTFIKESFIENKNLFVMTPDGKIKDYRELEPEEVETVENN